MILEVIGHKGVVGNATYQWMKAIHPEVEVVGRDKGDPLAMSIKSCKIHGKKVISFICVPEAIAVPVCIEAAKYAELVVLRSTVEPNTCKALQHQAHTCHLPEFLRESTAVLDEFNQNFILIGACCEEHGELLRRLYEPACKQVVITDTTTSELVKLSINNYLACLVSFWNEIEGIARFCQTSGFKVGAIASLDPRVSAYGAKYHQQYGGKCLPKDLKQMIDFAKGTGVRTPLLNAIQEVNECQTS